MPSYNDMQRWTTGPATPQGHARRYFSPGYPSGGVIYRIEPGLFLAVRDLVGNHLTQKQMVDTTQWNVRFFSRLDEAKKWVDDHRVALGVKRYGR